MSIFRVVLVLDDTNAAQAALLTSIQNNLTSIASNIIPSTVLAVTPSKNTVEVQKIA